jgi:8-oxo-dGTP diphosphatase
MSQQLYLVAIGLLRDAGRILMVRQQGPEDPAAYWVLPGGLAEPGEALLDALRREVYEESGLSVDRVKRLAYCTQILHQQAARQTIAYLFEVDRWHGVPGHRDPDGEILQVAWVPLGEALERLGEIGWRGMREPLIAYLRGEAPAGSFWCYDDAGGGQELIARLPSA